MIEKAKRLRDLPPPNLSERVVRSDGDGFIEFYNAIHSGNWEYSIATHEVQTRRGLLRWLHHLSEKNWITTKHLQQLIEVSCETFLEKPFDSIKE
uniref:Uncharacterized protein n=1 Tax=viral metagenome TaxID=1070528 RepID=A0A6H1ZIF9_9ZZZZ